MRFVLTILLTAAAAACNGTSGSNGNSKTVSTPADSPGPVPTYSIEVVKSYPHDTDAFTQGLVFHNGYIYEGTGGKPSNNDDFFSSLRKVELETGKVVRKHMVPPEFFGEGITILDDKVYQLTWQERTGFVYNLEDFKLLREVRYAGEGWGLTHDGTHLIMSDGTHVIRFIDPDSFNTLRTITVNDERGRPLMNLNELEYIKGEIWANVWKLGWIVRIDPASGKLLGKVDLTEMTQEETRRNRKADVLNGIAYDAENDRIFVTGKRWTRLFEIKVNPK
ncbi:MAG TPA: glutaminyl-peptide cyclotransferase [Pyrinomonadaceae bacterium]|nr:glutaminyl-peptide cyclotransferase [Pyrinomonadaceae bacterium]